MKRGIQHCLTLHNYKLIDAEVLVTTCECGAEVYCVDMINKCKCGRSYGVMGEPLEESEECDGKK